MLSSQKKGDWVWPRPLLLLCQDLLLDSEPVLLVLVGFATTAFMQLLLQRCGKEPVPPSCTLDIG